MSHSGLKAELSLLQSAAREAGQLAMRSFGNAGEIWDKGANHPVTKADLAVDEKLNQILRQARPDYGWLSEETNDDQSRLRAKRVFVVDPIDGTRAFIRGQPYFTIVIAIVENGRPIAGAVFNPALNEMYLAGKNTGATCNDKQITANKAHSIEGCKMMAHADLFRQKQWHEKWPEMQIGIRNSMAYRMALVADGNWDCTLTLRQKSDWDLAAADLIASEAGAVVSDPTGQEFFYNQPSITKPGVICASAPLHALVRKRIDLAQQKRKST